MQEQYKSANDKIHAPQELLEKTRKQMRKEKSKRKVFYIVRNGAAVACLCLAILGTWRFAARDKVYVEEIQVASAQWNIERNLGKTDTDKTGENAKDSEALNTLGMMQMKDGNYEDALKYFQMGLKNKDAVNKQELMKNEIAAYEYSGDFESAKKTMQAYIKEYKSDEEAVREYTFLKTR